MDDIHLEQVRSLMSQITDLMEDLWIERQGLRSVLAHHGFSREQFLEIEKAAKEDDDLRNQARLALFPYWAPRRWVASNLNLLGGPWPYAEFRDRGSESCD